jgi:DNA (cytosine-5)-methyltransferase 1
MGEQLTVGSLFSGIGGLDLGLERAGMRVIWQSEIDPYASRVLNKHWPEVPNYGDIKTIKWADVPPTDVICGGYPCQPFSLAASHRKGEADERHLWPWVRDAIRNLRPRYAILENVQGHLTLGATTVIREITDVGYMCEWRLIPASSVGARHKRNRLFIVAYSSSAGGIRRRGAFEGLNEEIREHTIRSADYWQNEPDVGRMAYGVPARMDRLRGLGNAVVPQVAELVGRLVIEHANNG